MLKFKKGGYTRHDSGTVYKVKDIFPNKYNPQVLLVSLVTTKLHNERKRKYVLRAIAGIYDCGVYKNL